MLIALILLGVLAVGLLVMLMLAKQSSAEFRAQADKREAALVAERDALNGQVSDLQGDVAGAEAKVTALGADVTKLKKEAVQAEAETRRITSERDHARVQGTELEARVEAQAGEIETLTTASESLQTTLGEAEQDLVDKNAALTEAEAAIAKAQTAAVAAKEQKVAALAEAAAELAELEARHNAGIVIGDSVDVGAANPQNLWELEVARSERTWRTNVAINPEAETTPFETAEDPVRLAVEIEAAALRENVGAFITIEWAAEPIVEPARRHLIVRVAQEMLEVAARSPEVSRLVVSGDEEISLRLVSGDDDEVVSLTPPRVVTDLVDVHGEIGLNVTVKAPVSAAD